MALELLKNGMSLATFSSDFMGKHICIGIDSSKSDTGFVVGDCENNFLGAYEFKGGGNEVNVFTLCALIKQQLDILLEGAIIEKVGIEDIITKRQKGKDGNYATAGLETHESRMKITAVWTRFIFYFQDRGIDPMLINNQAWKAAILPEGYNTRTMKKGSLQYYRAIGHPYGRLNDNVTDAACILQYVWAVGKPVVFHEIKQVYQFNGKKKLGLYQMDTDFPDQTKLYSYNVKFSFMDNINTICETLEEKYLMAVTVIPIEAIPVDILCSYLRDKTYPKECETLVAKIQRERVNN